MELKHRQILSAQVDLSKFNKANFEKATDEEKKQQDVMGESTTFFKDGMRRLRKNPLAMGSIIVLVLILLTIIIAPHVCPYKYSEIISVNGVRDKSAANLGPFEYSKLETKYMNETGEKLFPHIFGTDSLSRDYFIRVIYGTRVSLSVGVVASIMVLIIGLLYGSIAGYFGGKVDLIMMRIVDIIYSLPDMLIIILLSVVFNETLKPLITGTVLEKLGTNMISMFIVFALLYWTGMARMVRAQVMSLKEQEFALAAYVLGASKSRILFKHLVINCMGSIIVNVTLLVPSAIFTEAFLSFVGIGISAPAASWGTLANEARSLIESSNPIQIIWPILAICLTMLSLNFIGDGVSDAFDPKKK